MEAQQGVGNKGISTFLSFGAKNVQPDILEKMLVGRQKTVDMLEKYARDIAQHGVNHQVFIVGPRGSGKTHILRVLYYRISELVQTKAIVVAYFAEEEYGISGYLDFLIRIINAFMRWYDADKQVLESQLNILRETPENRQEYVAESIISDYVADKPLIILSENFDTILEALAKDGQSKLRAWLYRHNRISIIATAQATSPDLGREDRPFYGFFSTITLKKLTYEESLELLRNLAHIEENQTMIEHLAGKGQAQVRAIHELIKGNHRLLVTFYEFLKANSLADLSAIFMKTMNDLKPYYETFIRFLPAQQQKILHYLALAKIPRKGTDIGKNCFIATASLNKQLSELQRQHLIDALTDPSDKRNKLYDVSEPLLRIAIEIGEQREGVTALFIDFLALYYSHDEIKNQKEHFESLYISELEPLKKQKLYWEVEARERALKVQEELGLIQKNLSIEVWKLLELGSKYRRQENYEKAVAVYQTATQLVPDNEVIWTNLGAIYCDNQKNYLSAIEVFQKAIALNPNYETAWYNLGVAYSKGGKYIESINAYQKALQLQPNKASTWISIGEVYKKLSNYDKAFEAYHKTIQLNPDNEWAWLNLGVIYGIQGETYQSIESMQQVIRLNPSNESAWHNLGIGYGRSGNYEQAIKAYKEVIRINPSNERAWINSGAIYCDKQGNYLKAIDAFQKAIQIKQDNAMAWYNLGVAYSKHGNHSRAIEAYQVSLKIKPKNEQGVSNLEATITNYLSTQSTTEPELTALETWLLERSEFEIIAKYVNVYRRVVLGKEEKALYELPKEQRIFFEREILKKPAE